jgi:hypothetical protein
MGGRRGRVWRIEGDEVDRYRVYCVSRELYMECVRIVRTRIRFESTFDLQRPLVFQSKSKCLLMS